MCSITPVWAGNKSAEIDYRSVMPFYRVMSHDYAQKNSS